MKGLKILKLKKGKKQITVYDGGLFCGRLNMGDFSPQLVDADIWLGDGAEEVFAAVIQGDSMIGLGYMPGDFGIVNTGLEPKEGNVVVAYVNGEMTMKVLHIEPDGDKVVLFPANDKYEPIEVDCNADNFRIFGVVTKCIKSCKDGITIIRTRGAQYREKKRNASIERVKDCLLTLLGEDVMQTGKQWYAIYKVLIKYEGYPINMKEFCTTIENMELGNVKYACVYENWRKVGTEIRLPQNVDLWSQYADTASEKEKRQIATAERLMELLNDY